MKFLIRIVITAVALLAATRLVSGITFQGNWIGLAGVALVFGVLNSFVRPVLSFLAFPLLILTLGLFTFVLNAVMLLLTGALASKLGIDFHVAGFRAAFWGAIVVGIVSVVLSMLLPDDDRHRVHQVEG
ncbi:MAG: phage holin family protein [Gemmatimonadota bacterium]|nr:phage holin family protein [Gemmatimonadota bacterium]